MGRPAVLPTTTMCGQSGFLGHVTRGRPTFHGRRLWEARGWSLGRCTVRWCLDPLVPPQRPCP